jgi:hypothetical protein
MRLGEGVGESKACITWWKSPRKEREGEREGGREGGEG